MASNVASVTTTRKSDRHGIGAGKIRIRPGLPAIPADLQALMVTKIEGVSAGRIKGERVEVLGIELVERLAAG